MLKKRKKKKKKKKKNNYLVGYWKNINNKIMIKEFRSVIVKS